MSTINKKPYIETIIEGLTEQQITSLKSLLDGSQAVPTGKSFNDDTKLITTSDKGISFISLETKKREILIGYLIYTDNVCVLLSFTSNCCPMSIYNLNLQDRICNIVEEKLNVNELRRILGGGGGGGTAVESVNGKTGAVVLKTGDIHVTSDETDTKTVQSELERIDDSLDLKQDVLTAGENITIANNVISATGGGGTKLYKHLLTTDGDHELIFIMLTNIIQENKSLVQIRAHEIIITIIDTDGYTLAFTSNEEIIDFTGYTIPSNEVVINDIITPL